MIPYGFADIAPVQGAFHGARGPGSRSSNDPNHRPMRIPQPRTKSHSRDHRNRRPAFGSYADMQTHRR